MERKVSVLHIKDRGLEDLFINDLVQHSLYSVCYTVLQSSSYMDVIAACQADILLIDVPAKRNTARDIICRIRQKYPELPILLLAKPEREDAAIALLEIGAQDYLLNDRLKRLPFAIRQQTAPLLQVEVSARYHAFEGKDGLMAPFLRAAGLPEGTYNDPSINLEGALQAGHSSIYRQMLYAHALVAEADLSWNVLDINDAYCRLMDWQKEQVTGRNYLQLAFNSYPRRFIKKIMQQLLSGEPWKGTVSCKSAGGQKIWMEASIFPVKDAAGNIEKFIDVRTDITEQQLVRKENVALKEQLQNWDNRLRGIMRQSDDIIALYDKDQRPMYLNDALSRILGKPDIHNELLADAGFDEKYLQPALEEAFRNPGKAIPVRLRAYHHDGYFVWLEGYMANMLNDRNIKAIILNLKDNSRSISAEQMLQQTESMYRQIVETTEEGIWTIDANANTIFANHRMASMLEYTVEEMIGMNVAEFVDEEWQDRLHQQLEDRRLGKRSIFEFCVKTKSGKPIWLLLSASTNKDEAGNYTGAMVMATDITERKNADQAIRKLNRELKTLSAHLLHIREEERKEIARDIHDELGQQLTVMKMGLAWMLKKLPQSDREMLKRAENLIQLTDRTLSTMRRIASNLRPEVLDDMGLLPALKWLNKEITERYPIKLYFTSSLHAMKLPPSVLTGIFRIYQESLTNIIRHANAQHIHASLKVEGKVICLTVRDDGQGFRKETVMNQKKLGLLGIRERVYSLEGIFDLTSEPGKGTQLTITIPI